MQLDLDMLIAIRTAPNHSWINPAERCMSILNLALQHAALSRNEMDPQFEKMVKQKSSLNAIRNAAELKPALQTAYTESMDQVLNLLVERFRRMKLKGSDFTVYRGASKQVIEDCLDVVRDSCGLSDESKEKLTSTASAKDIKNIKEIQVYL